MATQVRLFISGGPDQEPAREMIGRALAAELPVKVGWNIKRTPDVDSVAECHLYVLLLGSDIWAPVGLEAWWAARTEKPILAYAGQQLRTPSGQVFYQEHAGLDWTRFVNLTDLRRSLLGDIGRFLLMNAERYGVTVLEAEALRFFINKLKESTAAVATPEPAGAGGGGVILAPGKDQPAGAQVVGEA